VTVLVDSDVLIEVSRARDLGFVARWVDLASSDAVVLFSAVTEAELWAGARPNEYRGIETLFQSLVCAPADSAVGRIAGDYLRQYRRSHGLELGDALIAATAVVNGAVLWTRNRKHYPMKELSFFD
jgi:predicted nucleic acid-binding protein